jgi:hypothetical protein
VDRAYRRRFGWDFNHHMNDSGPYTKRCRTLADGLSLGVDAAGCMPEELTGSSQPTVFWARDLVTEI